MAAISYESAQKWHETDSPEPKLIKTAQARSFLLRALEGSIAVRNNIDVRDIPERVPQDLDELVSFIEKQPFETMAASADHYLRKQRMKRFSGNLAVTGGGGEAQSEDFPVSGHLEDAVAVQVVTSFAFERFHSVNSMHLYNLHEVDLSEGLSEDRIERDRGVMRLMVAAVEEVEEGVSPRNSAAAAALGYRETNPDSSLR